MSKNKKQYWNKERKIPICKGCKSEIDEMGCIAFCEYDTGTPDRDPKTLEFLIYVFDRVEPYFAKKKKDTP
mgnify:CR=1 FL=1